MTTPPTDPLVRKEPPLDWYRTPSEAGPRVETAERLPDLDPDIALWPVTPLQRWPFTGAPAEGIWPKGWMGVDNTGTIYACTVGGEPGTWVAAGSGGSGLTSWGDASTATFVGSGTPVGTVTPHAEGDLYVDNTTPGLYQATGVADTDWQQVGGVVASVVAGTNVTVDDTDPHNPVVSAAGGSGMAEQEILQGTVLTLAPGIQGDPSWVHASGPSLLDLTDPANVAVVAAGNYGIAVTCLSNEAAMTVGGGFLLQLEYAGAGMLEDAVATANQLFPSAFVGAPPCPLSAEEGFSVRVTNNDPALTLQFDLQMLITKN